MLLKPCLECGELSDQPRCEVHRVVRTGHRTDTSRTAWIYLSQRARRQQPFCSLCGGTRHLQADHSPRAWARLAARLPLRLCDVSVLCARCNNLAGSSKPGSVRHQQWLDTDGDLTGTGPDTGLTRGERVTGLSLAPSARQCLSPESIIVSIKGVVG